MTERIKSLVKHPLVSGSSVVFLGSFGANFINYLFNLSMGRLLTISDYGLLTSLNSLFILVGIFSISFNNVMAKFSAKYFSLKDEQSTAVLINYAGKFILVFSGIIFVCLFLLVPQIGNFLHISNHFFIELILIALFFALVLSVASGFIQGRLQFVFLSFVTIIQPVIKIFIGVGLVLVGFSVFGSLVGIALSTALPAIALYGYLMRKFGFRSSQKTDTAFKKEFIHYIYTYFLSGVGISLLSNTDIILVRHFFEAQTSGQYAALSLMGKAILYFTAPITTVFFPIIAYKKERKERLFEVVLLACGIVVGVSVILSVIYFAFPYLVLRVFFPKPGYRILAHYLGYYSLYILVFSFASILNSYFLSIGRTKVYIITLVGAAIQIGSIILFHSSLYAIIAGLFTASLVMLLLFLIYYYIHGEH
ncbi:MAG TPA: oligosaccharide flippase family protein [Patescibacteria group bacterium]|nr:oligosaccharide flippase family protein [Patescibacteria group bacterium]